MRHRRLGPGYLLGRRYHSACGGPQGQCGADLLERARQQHPIGPTGATAIAEALRGNGVLNELNLRNNRIGPEGAKALGGALAVNEVLKNIDLRYNSLGDEGKGVIRDAVSGREGFKLEM